MYSTTETSNSETSEHMSLIKIKSDIGEGKYIILSVVELENIDLLAHKIYLQIRIQTILMITFLALTAISAVLGFEKVLTLGLLFIAFSFLLEQKVNRNLYNGIPVITKSYRKYLAEKSTGSESSDIFIFYGDREGLLKAEKALDKVTSKLVESQEYLIFNSKLVASRLLPSRILLLLGLILIATKYLFISFVSFVLIGGILFFVMVDVLGLIVDQIKIS